MKVNVIQKFGRFDDYWHPRIAAELNETYVKLVKVKGEFVWHKHEGEEESWVVLIEPKTTLNTGNVIDRRTLRVLEWV